MLTEGAIEDGTGAGVVMSSQLRPSDLSFMLSGQAHVYLAEYLVKMGAGRHR